MFKGETTMELRAKRDARREVERLATELALRIVAEYPGDDRKVELSELDDAICIEREAACYQATIDWLESNEGSTWRAVADEHQDLFTDVFSLAFARAIRGAE